MTKENTMTIEEMKKAIAAQEQENKLQADKLRSERDAMRKEAEKLHTDYMAFCKANDIPTTGGKGKTRKPKTTE